MRCVAAAADVEASSWSADSEVASRFAAPPWLLPMSVPLGDKVTREDDASTRSGDGETFHSDPLSVGDGVGLSVHISDGLEALLKLTEELPVFA